MSAITWVETIPSASSAVGHFPAWARSVWTSIAAGLGTSLAWDGPGGDSMASAGDLRPGASRTFFAARSASSSPSQGTGRLFFASDTSELLAYESAGTYRVGAMTHIEVSEDAQTGYWLRQSSNTSMGANAGTATITFDAQYADLPYVHLVSTSTNVRLSTTSLTTQFMRIRSFLIAAGGESTHTVTWYAVGRVSGASF